MHYVFDGLRLLISKFLLSGFGVGQVLGVVTMKESVWLRLCPWIIIEDLTSRFVIYSKVLV